ncbi:Kiwa anti-phage protein KwaB-like domain-containing protein [Sporosarcina sp. Te-1]|uniref:Kiwa anti-phage protein KwaB-like domain-containing protein n=1 Tax=Sporosarcina sp. Te-1 TaxID=2818390 RepID=UPI001A9D0E75|nr:Kiwa anti-phage protein KwaB-like domain-containing protein [Sporosarcina sp. Te-1]QTD39474.1 DUF4868 domain-containing protein [Sporosarcina sp. Te-1]
MIDNDEVVIENNSQEKDLPFQVSFYVIVHNEKFYFRKHMNNAFLKETKLAFEYNYEAELFDSFDKKLMVIDSTFDFYYQIDDAYLTIRNTSNFESVANYDSFFEKKRDEVLKKVQEKSFISNFEAFRNEVQTKAYLRFFSKINTDLLDELKKDTTFLQQLEVESKGEIKFDSTTNSFEVSPRQTKTMIHMLSYLIGRDLENQLIIFSDKKYIKFMA